MRTLLCLLPAVLLTTNTIATESQPPYRDPKLPIEKRVADLLPRMTLEEKIEQLMGGRRRWAQKATTEEEQKLFAKVEPLWHKEDETSAHDAAEIRNAMQKFLLE